MVQTEEQVVAEVAPAGEDETDETSPEEQAQGLSKAAKKRAKQKAKKALENGTAAAAGEDTAGGSELAAAANSSTPANGAAADGAESGDEDDEGDEAGAEGEITYTSSTPCLLKQVACGRRSFDRMPSGDWAISAGSGCATRCRTQEGGGSVSVLQCWLI
jgi:hypothetical protein